MIVPRLALFLALTVALSVRCLLTMRAADARLRAAAQGALLRDYLVRIGPLGIKFGQVIATRSTLLPREIIDALRALQDDVPPMAEADLRAVLAETYGRPLDEVFAEFSLEPLASASIAQVHEARLQTGERVAVKIVKRGVAERLSWNVCLIQQLLRVVHALIPAVRHLSLPARFDEITSLLVAQTDMREEARNQAAIGASFAGHPYVRVPRLYPSLCMQGVLVMDFVDALRGRDADKVEIPASQLARRIQDTIYTMLYHDGLCHADPHPGNLFFSKRGEIFLVDFGIVARLSEDEKWALSAYYYACTRKEWEVAVRRLTGCFVTERGRIDELPERFTAEMVAVLRHHYDERRAKWSTFEFFHDCSRVLRRYGARYTTAFTKVELVFVSCEGTANQIDHDIDIWENARKFNDRFSPYMSASVKATFDGYFGKSIPGSIALEERAKRTLVAPTHLDRYFVPSGYPLFVVKSSGSRIEDADGNSYVDLSCGYGPHILGYAHPVITNALKEAADFGWVNALGNAQEVELAEMLVDAFPAAERALFSNSGTEAVMQAIRLCRAYRGKDAVAKFEGHYHGYSDIGMVSSYFRFSGPTHAPAAIHGSPGCHRGTVEDTTVLQYGHPNAFAQLRASAAGLACVLCEPMPAGLGSYDQAFLQSLREVCTELDIPLVFDEVVSGFRVAYGGVQVLTGIEPDLTCLGKIIGGGLPCGAVVGREKLVRLARTTSDPFTDFESRVFVGGTMSGNSLSCAAGLAALRHLKAHPEIYVRLDASTQWLGDKLRSLARSRTVPFQLQARHSIFGMTFSSRPAQFHREKIGSNFKANLGLAYYMRKHAVYMPELHTMMLNAAHSQEDLETVASAFALSLDAMVEDGFFVL